MPRYLRIAVTALALSACVLVVGVWVRSYFGNDFVFKRLAAREITVQTSRGALNVWTISPAPQLPYQNTDWSIGRDWSGSNAVAWNLGDGTPVTEWFGFRFGWSSRNSVVSIPFLAIVLPLALAAALPWTKQRFSLRTLLIATTLVAVALGIVVAM